MSLTTHLGYGPFQLGDFEPGEFFARFTGALARVCDPQPKNGSDRIQVWTDYYSLNARREWLHKTALAYAVDEEQAWAIHNRKKGAKS